MTARRVSAPETSVREHDKFMLRMPDGMRELLKKVAAASGRSLNAEIVQRLQWSIDEDAANERATVHLRLLEQLSQGKIDRSEVPDLPEGTPRIPPPESPEDYGFATKSDIAEIRSLLQNLLKENKFLQEELSAMYRQVNSKE